jgi:hypothetical protein
MSKNEYAINLNTGRLIKKTTSLYRKLKKLNLVKEIEEPKVEIEQPKQPKQPKVEVKEVIVETPKPEYNEALLKETLADLSTDLIKSNLKKVVKAQKLSDNEMDDMLRRLLYKKLCVDDPKHPKPKEEKKKKKPKPKFKIIESSSSESESD